MIKKILPKDTNVSKYFEYSGHIFEKMELPDGRIMIQIVHTWGDGGLMDFGFEFADGIPRTGINPLHLVGVFYRENADSTYIESHIDKFLKTYHKKTQESAG